MGNREPVTLNRSAAWITWEIQVRNRSMSRELGVPLFELITKRKGIVRYVELSLKTIGVISREKVKVLFVQNPSIVLSLLAVLVKPIFRLFVVVDAHNSGIHPLAGKSRILNRIAKIICRKSDIVIVTNPSLEIIVREVGGNPFVMPDPIPEFECDPGDTSSVSEDYILFICTWSEDEPYEAVIEAARSLENEITIYVTGNYQNKLSYDEIQTMPKNVKLLGFVSSDEYIQVFKKAIAAIDLTTRENCLVCGAYEGISLGVPMIVSDDEEGRKIFTKGFYFTNNDAEGIATSIRDSISNNKRMREKIEELRGDHRDYTEKNINKLVLTITGSSN
ncbi:glycosyltransferase [Marinimicrobium sp. C2-29]|uniref:glycosyltransferase n=1 Tax=Marinimicrobium sp. C2-29 TaxID=3139825 RepID=UPI0031399B73